MLKKTKELQPKATGVDYHLFEDILVVDCVNVDVHCRGSCHTKLRQ